MGSPIKMETTIIGDAVNVAARLQQLNREHDTQLLISASTHKLVQGEFPLQLLGDMSLRGRKQTTTVYNVDIPAILSASTHPIIVGAAS